MAEKTVRIGLLSFAHLHATSYTDHLQKQPGVKTVGLWNENAQVAEKMAARYGIPRYGSPDALIEAGLDGVVICSVNKPHSVKQQ
mgnify:CR=1 FL=1